MTGPHDDKPGLTLLMTGALLMGQSAAQVAQGPADGVPRPGWTLFAGGTWALGTLFCLWGWCRLRRAKRDRPGVTWWQFLRGELATLGVVAAFLAAFLSMSEGQRRGLTRSLLELVELLHVARGGLP